MLNERPQASGDPLDDPVLKSYTKCLAKDILCVWRRVSQHKNDLDQTGGMGMFDISQIGATSVTHPPLSLTAAKELWIFWYGEEPDLTDLVSPELLRSSGKFFVCLLNTRRQLTQQKHCIRHKPISSLSCVSFMVSRRRMNPKTTWVRQSEEKSPKNNNENMKKKRHKTTTTSTCQQNFIYIIFCLILFSIFPFRRYGTRFVGEWLIIRMQIAAIQSSTQFNWKVSSNYIVNVFASSEVEPKRGAHTDVKER